MENAAVRTSLKPVRWKESLTSWTPQKFVLPPTIRRNPPCLTAPRTGASLQRKPLRKDLLCQRLWPVRELSPDCRHCLQVCVVVLRHCLPPPLDSSD